MTPIRSALAVSLTASLLLGGCAEMIPALPGVQRSQAELTPEQSQRLADALLQRLERQPSSAAAAPSQAAQTPPAATLSETELAKRLAQQPALPTGVVVEGRRDGFAVNGTRYIDPEGAIVRYGADPLSGDVTYMAQIDRDSFVLKTLRVATGTEPITIGTASRRSGLWQVDTVTGKTLRGWRLIPLARGVLVGRDNTGFAYVAGEGTRSFAAPESFDLAGFQNGDIAGTDYVLLERRQEEAQGPFGETIGAIAALGNALGVVRKEDYVLYSMSTGKMHPLDIAADGKSTSVYSQCKRRNAVLNLCDRVDFVDSLYDAQGMPNFSHYYWRVSWYRTPQGPIAIAQESGLKDITVTDLGSGKKVTAFNRELGIAGFTSRQGADGRVSVVAQMGFGMEALEDAAALLAAPSAGRDR